MSAFKKITGVFLLLVAMAGAWYFLGAGRNAADLRRGMENTPVPVSVVPVRLQDMPVEIQAVGTAVAYQSVAVRPRIDSQILEVKFKDGDDVRQGDLLFVLDGRSLQAQLNQQEANLARDRAQLDNLRRQLERKTSLSRKGYETASSLDDAQAEFDVQAATVKATQAAIENLKVQLQYTQITAPIGGRTGTIRLTAGNNVKAGDAEPLVTINQVRPVLVQVSLPQGYFSGLRRAMTEGIIEVRAKHEGQEQELSGHVEYIDNAVDEATGTFVVRASFANDDELLWPGMFVNVVVRLGTEKHATTVPEVAVQHGQEGDFVFVIVDAKAAKRPVKVGRLQQGLAVISEGLSEGEQVAVDGLAKLGDGSSVAVAVPASPPPSVAAP